MNSMHRQPPLLWSHSEKHENKMAAGFPHVQNKTKMVGF